MRASELVLFRLLGVHESGTRSLPWRRPRSPREQYESTALAADFKPVDLEQLVALVVPPARPVLAELKQDGLPRGGGRRVRARCKCGQLE